MYVRVCLDSHLCAALQVVLPAQANLDFSDASHLAMYVQKSREKARDDLKAEAGFTEEQTQELQMKFNEHDEDGSGDIEYKDSKGWFSGLEAQLQPPPKGLFIQMPPPDIHHWSLCCIDE
eukprot:2745911-Amphidinium_carterae.1